MKLDNIKFLLDLAITLTLIFLVLVIITWLAFNKIYPLLDKIYEKYIRTTPNDRSGRKEYYNGNDVHRFEYWHGDQDGTLYKITHDKKRVVVEKHTSIEMADNMMDCYRKTGVYKEDKE